MKGIEPWRVLSDIFCFAAAVIREQVCLAFTIIWTAEEQRGKRSESPISRTSNGGGGFVDVLCCQQRYSRSFPPLHVHLAGPPPWAASNVHLGVGANSSQSCEANTSSFDGRTTFTARICYLVSLVSLVTLLSLFLLGEQQHSPSTQRSRPLLSRQAHTFPANAAFRRWRCPIDLAIMWPSPSDGSFAYISQKRVLVPFHTRGYPQLDDYRTG